MAGGPNRPVLLTDHKFDAVDRLVNIFGYIFYMKTEKARKISAGGNYNVKLQRRVGEEDMLHFWNFAHCKMYLLQ